MRPLRLTSSLRITLGVMVSKTLDISNFVVPYLSWSRETTAITNIQRQEHRVPPANVQQPRNSMENYVRFPPLRLSTASTQHHSSLIAKTYGTISPCQTTPSTYFPPQPSRPTDPSRYPPSTPPPRYSIDGAEIDPRHPRYLLIMLVGMLAWMGLCGAAVAMVFVGKVDGRSVSTNVDVAAITLLALALQMLGTSGLRRVVRMYMPRDGGCEALGLFLAGVFYVGPALLAVAISAGTAYVVVRH
nr:hypothetical protein CFP56_16234 [Quercus suber]